MATAWLPFAGGLIGDCSLSEQRDRLLRDRGSLDGKRKRSSRKNSQREGMSGLERKRQVCLNPSLWASVMRGGVQQVSASLLM